jgi:hypothetical protein
VWGGCLSAVRIGATLAEREAAAGALPTGAKAGHLSKTLDSKRLMVSYYFFYSC